MGGPAFAKATADDGGSGWVGLVVFKDLLTFLYYFF